MPAESAPDEGHGQRRLVPEDGAPVEGSLFKLAGVGLVRVEDGVVRDAVPLLRLVGAEGPGDADGQGVGLVPLSRPTNVRWPFRAVAKDGLERPSY